MKRVWRWTVFGQDLIGPFRIGCCYLTASEMPAVVFLSSRAIWPVLRRYSWFCRVFRFSAPDVSTNDNNNDDSFITANDDDFEVDEYDCIEDDSISRTYELGQIIEVYWDNYEHKAKSWTSSNSKVVQVKTNNPETSCYLYMRSVGKATVSIKIDNGNVIKGWPLIGI